MTISNRAKVLVAGILILLAIVLILLFMRGPEEGVVTPEPEEERLEILEEEPQSEEEAPAALSDDEIQAVSSATVASIFVERFGSYSSESDLANIEDVLPLATERYRKELEALIASVRAGGRVETYYGVTTRVLSKKVVEMDTDAGKAVYEVLTQREEAMESVQETTVRYQSIRIELQEVNGVWLVNSATWL